MSIITAVKTMESETLNPTKGAIAMSETIETTNLNPMEGEMPMQLDENHECSTGLGEQGEETTFFPLADIQCDPFFDCRVGLNEDAIERYTVRFANYKAALDNGKACDYPFPPIVVWFDSGIAQFVRLTGSHRCKAADNAGLDKILVKVFYGSKLDALKIALQDNRENAAHMTRGDLRLCIEKALEQFRNIYTPGVIAEMLDCSPAYVSEIDNELSASGNEVGVEKRMGKDKKMYPVKRKNTGRQKKAGKKQNITSPGASNSNLAPTQPKNKPLQKTTEHIDTSPDGEVENGNGAKQTKDSENCPTDVPDDVPNGTDVLFDFGENKESEKSTKERLNETFDCIYNSLDGLFIREGKEYIRELYKVLGRVEKHLNKQGMLNTNAAIILKDQLPR